MHTLDPAAPERAKYDEIWSMPEYRVFSPGMENVDRFIQVLKPTKGDTLIDIGCGEGKAGLAFQEYGLDVSWLDITEAQLSEQISRKRFIESPIWHDLWTHRRVLGWQYGFCCDVMEHIPIEFTMLSLERIIRSCRTSWFQISHEPDMFGHLIGTPLHLTVQPFDWWRDRIASVGVITDARDLCGMGLFVVRR